MSNSKENSQSSDEAHDFFAERNSLSTKAKELAKTEEEIIATLLRLDEEKLKEKGDWNFHKEEDGSIIYSFFGEYFGQEDLWIYYHYLPTNLYRESLGINTSTRLSLDLYTDRETADAERELTRYDWAILGDEFDEEDVKKVLTPEEFESATYGTIHDDGDTNYFFDLEGNFAKVIGLPEELADGRDVVDIEGHPVGGVAYLHTKMTPRDCVIAKMALGIVNEKVQESFELQHKEILA